MSDASPNDTTADLRADLRLYLGFSDEVYLANNPDVAEAGLDPFAHFTEFGRYERARSFGFHTRKTWAEAIGFDADAYLARNPDVAEAGVDPLWHFWRWGFSAGRIGGPRPSPVPASAVWERLGVEPGLRPAVAGPDFGGGASLDGIDIGLARETLGIFLRRGPIGLYGSDAAMLLGRLALLAGEPAVAEALFETHRLGPPYFLKPGETEIRSVAAYPARSLRDYCAARELRPTKVASPEQVIVPAYAVAGRGASVEIASRVVERRSAELFALTLNNATVFPGQDFLLGEDGVVAIWREGNEEAGQDTEDGTGNGLVAFAGGFAVVEWAPGEPLPDGVSLLGRGSRSLWTWVLDRVPRLRLLPDGGARPVLTEPMLPLQFDDWAKLAYPDTEFASVSAPRRVGRLDLIVALGDEDEWAGSWPPSVLAWIRALADDDTAAPVASRLFLSRGFAKPDGAVNRNSVVLQDQLGRLGFVVLDPSRASVREQLRAVRGASAIVAEFGPALVDLVACRPRTPIVVVGNESGEAEFDHVARLAAEAGCRVTFYKGLDLKRTHPIAARNDYLVDVADCVALVTRLVEGA